MKAILCYERAVTVKGNALVAQKPLRKVLVAQNPLLKALVAQIPLLQALVAWPRGVENRFGTGLNFNTLSMANGPVRGKSWGGPHGRLPVAQNCL